MIALDLGRGLRVIDGPLDSGEFSSRAAAQLGAARAQWGEPNDSDAAQPNGLRQRLAELGSSTGEIVFLGLCGGEADVERLLRTLASGTDYYEESASAEAICRITDRTRGIGGLGGLLCDDAPLLAAEAARLYVAAADAEAVRSKVARDGTDLSARVLAILDWSLHCPADIRASFPPEGTA